MSTLNSVFKLLFPDVPTSPSVFAAPPALPADIFAFAAYVLESSGAYHHISPETGAPVEYRHLVIDATMRGRARRIGRRWRNSPAAAGRLPDIPAHVATLWQKLRTHRNDAIFASLPADATCPNWWAIVIDLLMIADEASENLGFDTKHAFYRPIAEAFLAEDVVSGREFRRVQSAPTTLSTADQSVVCVQAKSRTPSVGCTLRSLTHHLALLPGQGAARARWITSPFLADAKPADRLGLLLIPLPYKVEATAFVGRGDHKGRWGWFDVDQQWLPATDDIDGRRAFVAFVLDLVRSARRQGRRVDGVVFPELALDYRLFRRLARAVAEEADVDFLISGLGDTKEGRAGNFVAIAPFFLVARDTKRSHGLERLFLIREKHHRWKLTGAQIKDYGIGAALDPARNWWEHLNLMGRSLDLFVYRGDTSLTTLICEDLARVDPCQSVLRSIGPNLVIALLMDGPQLEGRWPARYATVLADDPGSSVLTFTCLGLMERQNARKSFPQSSAIALWKDEANGVKRLELPRDSDALFLELVADYKTEHTLDGRSDKDSAHRWVYKDYHGIAANAALRPEWIRTGNPR